MPRFRIAVIQILRERNRPFSQLVLRLNINQPGPEALYQIISKRGHLPRPDPCIGFKLSALMNCSNTSRLGGYEVPIADYLTIRR